LGFRSNQTGHGVGGEDGQGEEWLHDSEMYPGFGDADSQSLL